MTTTTRRLATMLATAGATVAMAAAAAWACTGQPLLEVAVPVAAPETQVATVVRATDPSRPTPVELRWNGLNGPVVASAMTQPGTDLAVPVQVPKVGPGVYYLVLVTDGQGVGRAAVQVTGSSIARESAWNAPAERPATGAGLGAFAAGAALLGVGLLGLAGLAGAALKRSRTPANAPTSDQ